MWRLYASGAAVIAGLSVALWVQVGQIKALKAEGARLVARLAAAEETARVEYRTRTVIREIHVKSGEAQAHVQTAPDPECGNPEPLLASWRDGIDGVRQASATSGDSSGGA